jgi:ATP-dependent RNA/DNA helicase IGHMBP2
LVNVLFGIYEPTINEETNYEKIKYFNENLNPSQKEAIIFAMRSNELALIHGPPGTGKTTTVVELILQVIQEGKKILVVAPSNIAVDNIAEKLLPFRYMGFDLVRIGHPARIMSHNIEISLDNKVEKSSNMKFVKETKRSIERVRKELSKVDKRDKEKRAALKKELKSLREDIKGSYKTTVIEIYNKCKVVLATCVGAGDNYLQDCISSMKSEAFDLVIIDEAAQATESLCWISILKGKKLILAGDHLQLPPTIKSKEAEKGLAFTLFDRMIKLYEEKVSKLLSIQYRMNKTIMSFSSKELYDNKLQPHESVSEHKLTDFLCKTCPEYKDKDDLNILGENLILVDTSGIQFYESLDSDSSSRLNIGESKICKFLVDYLLKFGIEKKQIGIITPYSAQVNTLRDIFNIEEYKELEISTVDGFQGREKEIIVLSLVRSNLKHEVGFLADERRLNVAITRARRMVVLITDTDTVSSNKFLKKMCDYFNEFAKNINVIGDIFEYHQLQEIQFESNKEEIKKKEEKKASKTDGNNQSDSKKKKNKNKKNQDKKDEKVEQNKKGDGQFAREKVYNEKHSITTNTNNHQSNETIDPVFVEKIKYNIQSFIKSHEDEFKIEGLSNVERRLIHIYAEENNLIHESQGTNENRLMVLRKKKDKQKSPNIAENLKQTEEIPKIKLKNKKPKSDKKEEKVFILKINKCRKNKILIQY